MTALVIYTCLIMIPVLYLLLQIRWLVTGMMILLVFLYLPVLKRLYRIKWSFLLQLLGSCCAFALIVWMLTTIVLHLITGREEAGMLLLIQSMVYLLLVYPFYRLVLQKLQYILENIPRQANSYLFLNCFILFMITICMYLGKNSLPLTGFFVLLLSVEYFFSFYLLNDITMNVSGVSKLERAVYFDSLTGLKNRTSLYRYAGQLILQQRQFCLIFMDLDFFKSINDRYGHLAGDHYLCAFAKKIVEMIGENGTLFRMFGDEFICIYEKENVNEFLSELEEAAVKIKMEPDFLGFSFGWANFPEGAKSLDGLILQADRMMYDNKKKQHKSTAHILDEIPL